jgi:hypothetical protein
MILAGIILLLNYIRPLVAYSSPPALYSASEYTNWSHKFENSRLADIEVPFTNAANGQADFIKMKRLDLVGDEYTRGKAHGALIAFDIVEFIKVKLPVYYADMILDLDISMLPKFLQVKTKQLGLKAPEIFAEALQYVYDREEQYMPVNLINEMNGIAEGVCITLSRQGQGKECNVTDWQLEIKRANMLPELIRMACTAYGAWGTASHGTSDGSLVQVRALDFGKGPFSNYTVINVHRNPGARSFVMVGFPGFVGAITGTYSLQLTPPSLHI